MRAPSRVTRELTPEHRAELDALIVDRRMTLDELIGWLSEREYSISRSSLHRYASNFEERLVQLSEAKERASAILDRFSGKPATALAEGASMLMQDLFMKKLLETESLDADTDIVELAHALAKLETSGVGRERLKVQWDKGITAGSMAVKANLRRELEKEPDLMRRMLDLVERAEAEARAV